MRRRLVIALAGAGLLVAGYLSVVHSRGVPPVCIGSGCATVAASPYARLLGVPIAYLGLPYYALLLGLALRSGDHPASADAILALSLTGTLFSAYLTYLEIYVVRAICLWCVVSAAAATGIFLLSLPGLRGRQIPPA